MEEKVLVDDFSYYVLREFNWWGVKGWGSTFYAVTWLNNKCVHMHRLILGLHNSKNTIRVDHKDGNGLNNCFINLRHANRFENSWNSKKPCSSWKGTVSSKYKGVSQERRRPELGWRCVIKHHGKYIHLGRYSREEDAARAYDEAARKYFGEFARLNFSGEGV